MLLHCVAAALPLCIRSWCPTGLRLSMLLMYSDSAIRRVVRVQFARGKNDGQDYAIKFFTMREAFEREDALYSNKVCLPAP